MSAREAELALQTIQSKGSKAGFEELRTYLQLVGKPVQLTVSQTSNRRPLSGCKATVDCAGQGAESKAV